jgi:hypothetical protein
MNPGDHIRTVFVVRSPRSGMIMPREGVFMKAVENLGRQMCLVEFSGNELKQPEQVYLFPDEIKAR